MAARMTIAQTACLRYCLIASLCKIPNPDNTDANVGSSNTIPNVIAIDVNRVQALEDMKRQLHVVLAKGKCKNITKEEVYRLVDEIFDEYC